MKHKVKFLSIALTGCFLAGCTCYNTHVPGRHIDHGENPSGIDRFFCNLDYILFPPEQGYIVAPPPEPVVVQPVVVPEYDYGWWQGAWVPRYQDWYWYHGTWVWGGSGMRPVPPAWAPDPNHTVPTPIQPPAVIVTPAPVPAPAPVVVIENRPTPPPAVIINHGRPHHHGKPAPSHRPAPSRRHSNVSRPAGNITVSRPASSSSKRPNPSAVYSTSSSQSKGNISVSRPAGNITVSRPPTTTSSSSLGTRPSTSRPIPTTYSSGGRTSVPNGKSQYMTN